MYTYLSALLLYRQTFLQSQAEGPVLIIMKMCFKISHSVPCLDLKFRENPETRQLLFILNVHFFPPLLLQNELTMILYKILEKSQRRLPFSVLAATQVKGSSPRKCTEVSFSKFILMYLYRNIYIYVCVCEQIYIFSTHTGTACTPSAPAATVNLPCRTAQISNNHTHQCTVNAV